jgi:hypothetical protein
LEAGVKLVIISIGKPQSGKELCQHLGVEDADDFIFVDPNNAVYDDLDLNRGIQSTFFNPATPLSFGRRLLRGEGLASEELKEVLGKWKDGFYMPPKSEQGFQQGGSFIFTGKQTVYAHYDEATAAHAIPDEMVELALATSSASL